MTSTQTGAHAAAEESPGLALWLVQSSAALRSARSIEDLLDTACNSIQQIVPFGVSLVDSAIDTALAFPIKPAVAGHATHIQTDTTRLEPRLQTAIHALLSVLEPLLEDQLDQVGHTPPGASHNQPEGITNARDYSYADALNDVTLTAASTHELAHLYEAVRDVLAKVLPMDVMLIAMIPPGQDLGVTVYKSERGMSYFNRTPLSEPFQRAMRHGSPFLVDEIPQELSARQYRFGDPDTVVRSLVAAPLVANERVSGLIVVQSYEPAAFRAEHGDLLLHIGTSIAGALERAELIDQLRSQSIRENALRTVTERLTSTLNPSEQLCITVAELATALEGAGIAAVRVTNPVSPLEQAEVAVWDDAELCSVLGIKPDEVLDEQGTVARTILSGTIVQDLNTDGASLLSLPMHAGTDCIGAIAIAREGNRPISDEEYAMLATLSGTLSSALQMARLYVERSRHEQDLLEVQRISQLVASSLDAKTILNEIITRLPQIFNAESCYVRVVDGDALVPLAIQDTPDESFAPRVPIATSLAGRIVQEKRVVSSYDLRSDSFTGEFARATGVTTRGWIGAPLVDIDGSVIGVLSIRCAQPRNWTERDIVLLQTLAITTTVAIQNAWRFARTRDVLMASIESLANAVDAKDPTTLNHSRNVADYARKIAEAMGRTEEEIETTALAGLLHDIGKIGIPDRILQKAGTLDTDEWERMKTHPVIGEQILSGNPHLAPVLSIVRHHHERWDGTGYPDGMAGDAIPVGAAIVALADAVETMSSARPYSHARPWDTVCEIVRTGAGKQFHPEVVRCFLELADQGLAAPSMVAPTSTSPVLSTGTTSLGYSLAPRAAMIFHGIAREVRALTDLETFIANITKIIREVMELREVHIFLVDEYSGEIIYRPFTEDQSPGRSSVRRLARHGVVGWVIEHGIAQLIPDVSLDERFVSSQKADTRSELAVPLIADGAVIGAINVESPRIAAFSDSDERLLSITADHLAQTIQVARLHDRFKHLASTDALTGLPNHRAFYERLDEEIRHALVTDGILTVAIVDINQLKEINDTFGHLAGDTILSEIALTLRERCRRSDFVARYGGDEFVFILPDTGLEGASRAMENIIAGLETRSVLVNGERLRLPSGAWGMAAFPDDGVRPAELVRVADLRMYNHKNFSRTALPKRVEMTHDG